MGLFDKKSDDGSGDGEVKKRGFKTYLIIGIVVIAIIVAVTIKVKSAPATATEEPYSLVDAQADIAALTGNYTLLAGQVTQATTNVAKAASDIASINSRISGITSTDWGPTISALQNTQQSLQSSLSVLTANVTTLAGFSGNTTVGNVTFNFTALNASVTTLTATANNLTSQLASLNTKVTQLATNQTANLDEFWASFGALNATVSNLTTELYGLTFSTLNYVQVNDVQPAVDSNIAWITVHGSGSFPVVVTFYGDNLTDTATNVFSPAPSCTLAGQYLYGTSILSAVITPPVSGWADNHVLMVTVTKGIVDYATAVIGGS